MVEGAGVELPGGLPSWAVVSERREAHIVRVVTLLYEWAGQKGLSSAEAFRWCHAGWLHDALRGAPSVLLNGLVPELDWPPEMRHGPAAANRATSLGEQDLEVLEAVRWHTVGSAAWAEVGRALYCADFLEPGRSFMTRRRAKLAATFPSAPDDVLREVVELRVARSLERGVTPNGKTLEFRESLN